MKINFIIEDWKQLLRACEQVINLANKKRYYFRMIDTGGDDYVVAYSKEKFSEKEALRQYFEQ